jgi:hypothetical protein
MGLQQGDVLRIMATRSDMFRVAPECEDAPRRNLHYTLRTNGLSHILLCTLLVPQDFFQSTVIVIN